MERANADLLRKLMLLDPLEQLGKAMYLDQPSQILQPITNQAQFEQVRFMMQAYGIPDDDSIGELGIYDNVFSSSITEQASIRGCFDIAVGVHPRYIGNAPHSHDFFEINYVCHGSMTQTVGQQTMVLNPGDLVLLCPGVSHDVLSLMDDNVMLTIRLRKSTFYKTFFSLFNEGDILYQYFHSILFYDRAAPFLLFRTGEDDNLMSHFLRMYQESNAPRAYSNQYLDLLMSEVFLELLRDHCKDLSIGTPVSNEDASMALILHYIAANCCNVTLGATARQFHYNASYLSRLLKNSFGKNFLEIRTELRLERAKELLESSEYTSAQIAAMVGYQNVSYFHKAFKQHTNMTPIAYRTSVRSV